MNIGLDISILLFTYGRACMHVYACVCARVYVEGEQREEEREREVQRHQEPATRPNY